MCRSHGTNRDPTAVRSVHARSAFPFRVVYRCVPDPPRAALHYEVHGDGSSYQSSMLCDQRSFMPNSAGLNTIILPKLRSRRGSVCKVSLFACAKKTCSISGWFERCEQKTCFKIPSTKFTVFEDKRELYPAFAYAKMTCKSNCLFVCPGHKFGCGIK